MYVISAPVLDRWNRLGDEDIVQRVLAGQTAMFEILMRRHNERVYRAARAVLGDDSEAEDVMQQAYVNAFVHLRQFDGRAAFATWLTRIAVNEAIARARRRSRWRPLDEAEGDVTGGSDSNRSPERQAFAGELRVLLETAIDALPPGCREAFVLRQVEGLSTAETAECLGISEDAVKTRLSRSRALLRRRLTERLGEAAAAVFRFERPRCDRVVAAVLARIG